jgi:hypothetical protein
MFIYTTQYGWAVVSFFLNISLPIWLIVRFIIWGRARKLMYVHRDYDSFEEYMKKTESAEKTCTTVFLIFLCIFVLLSVMWIYA